jgi:uncharacterized protein (UPF0216 family)
MSDISKSSKDRMEDFCSQVDKFVKDSIRILVEGNIGHSAIGSYILVVNSIKEKIISKMTEEEDLCAEDALKIFNYEIMNIPNHN